MLRTVAGRQYLPAPNVGELPYIYVLYYILLRRISDDEIRMTSMGRIVHMSRNLPTGCIVCTYSTWGRLPSILLPSKSCLAWAAVPWVFPFIYPNAVPEAERGNGIMDGGSTDFELVW